MAQHIFTGTTPPASAPTAVGQHYIDTAAKKTYISAGTATSGDWKLATDTDTGITQLTGDVVAGPGSGSQAATLADIGASGTFTNATVTIDTKGRVVGAASGVPGGITSINVTAPLTSTGGSTPTLGVTLTSPAWGDITGTLTDQTDLETELTAIRALNTGNANSFAGFDGSGNLFSIPGVYRDTTSGGYNEGITQQPNNLTGGFTQHSVNAYFDPLQNSPDDSWNLFNAHVEFDVNSSGFSQGSNGNALNLNNMNVTHHGTGPIGYVNMLNSYIDFGNGTDPITVRGFSYASAYADISSGVTISQNIQGYTFSPNFHTGAILQGGVQGFCDFSNWHATINGYTSYFANPNIDGIANNHNYNGFNVGPNITELFGNAGFTGFGCFANIGSIGANGNFNGVSISPNITTNKNYAVGVTVNMDNVTNDPGVKSSLVVQDITYQLIQPGTSGDNITVEYLNTATAGSEVATLVGSQHVQVTIQSGVTTATQVRAALLANFTIASNLTFPITGTGSNAQVTFAQTNLAGGVNAGRKQAGFFKGDVEIQGALAFSGALSIGALTSYAGVNISAYPGGVNSIDSLITSPTIDPGTTLNTDLLAINTAMLLNVGAGATATSSFLGYVALGLPAVLSMGVGATIDRVSGATFALSLDVSGTGGTADIVALCRALAIPNGVTAVNRLYGYEFSLPFGDPGTLSWGFYAAAGMANWLKAGLRIGGTTLTDDVPAAGYMLDVDGDSQLRAKLSHTGTSAGFFGVSAVSQPTSAGAVSAGALYTATEQTMLQQVYDALRALGLMA